MTKENILVSACLLGVKCRYDGKDKENQEMIGLMEDYNLIPICPEQLGGLETPRDPAEMIEGKMISIKGKDVTLNYDNGANEAFKMATLYKCKTAYLKSDSPMCGHGKVYDGSFSGNKIQGDGVFTKLLLKNGIKVISK